MSAGRWPRPKTLKSATGVVVFTLASLGTPGGTLPGVQFASHSPSCYGFPSERHYRLTRSKEARREAPMSASVTIPIAGFKDVYELPAVEKALHELPSGGNE